MARGVLAGDTPALLIAAAQGAGRRVVVDPKGADYARYAEADVITPNRRQLADATGLPAGTDAEIAVAALALRSAHGFGTVLVTRGEDGMTLADAAGVLHLPSAATDVYDPSGAGDTVVAALAAGLAAGLDMRIAARLANLAGGAVVGKIGIAVAREEDLLQALAPRDGAPRKIVSRETAAEQIERWRRRGWRTGFITGVFDLVHPGHVHLLEQARIQCDRLVVGVSSDVGLSLLPGGSMAQPEAARAAMLASLSSVDLVCLFDEDTPVPLFQALRPDLLVRGADGAMEDMSAASQADGWEGGAPLAKLLYDYSAAPVRPPVVEAPSRG